MNGCSDLLQRGVSRLSGRRSCRSILFQGLPQALVPCMTATVRGTSPIHSAAAATRASGRELATSPFLNKSCYPDDQQHLRLYGYGVYYGTDWGPNIEWPDGNEPPASLVYFLAGPNSIDRVLCCQSRELHPRRYTVGASSG